jgi:hypothetical protein
VIDKRAAPSIEADALERRMRTVAMRLRELVPELLVAGGCGLCGLAVMLLYL